MLEQEGLEQVPSVGLGMGCGTSGPSQSPGPLLMCCLHKGQKRLPPLSSDPALGLSCLFPSQLSSLFSCFSSHPSVELHQRAGGAGVSTQPGSRDGLSQH